MTEKEKIIKEVLDFYIENKFQILISDIKKETQYLNLPISDKYIFKELIKKIKQHDSNSI